MPPPDFDLAALKATASPIASNASASLWDTGDGVAAFELHDHHALCTPNTIALLERSLARVRESFRALLLVCADPDIFCLGASLDPVIEGIERRDWPAVDAYLRHGQDTLLAMKYAPFPTIAAIHGRTASGGLEVALHATTIVAAHRLFAGFRERWAGVVPSWGGATQMLARWLARGTDPDSAALRAFEHIADARPMRTAAGSQECGVLRPTDIIVDSRQQALTRGRALAIETAPTYTPPSPPRLALAGPAARAHMVAFTDKLTSWQRLGEPEILACHALADLYTSGDPDLSERDLMARERAAVVELVKAPAIIERMKTVRATGQRPEEHA